jgi:Na+/melibiose symporter-like transporter
MWKGMGILSALYLLFFYASGLSISRGPEGLKFTIGLVVAAFVGTVIGLIVEDN